jgi:uncharacterized protein (TIGR02246 family)
MLHKFSSIFVLTLATIVVSIAPQIGFSAEPMTDARAKDYAAIQTLIVKYAHVYDALDVEGYVSVFADDAVFTFGGNTLNGRSDIREFITEVASSPEPDMKSYHSISNTLIEFVSDNEAHHVSYWQVITGTAGTPFTVINMGIYEDVIVKKNGQWLIQKRNIPQ